MEQSLESLLLRLFQDLMIHNPRQPDNDEKKLMIQLAIECLLRTSLENHVYSFNGEIKLQSSGGAIGDSLTGAIAAVYVIHWSKEFK